MTAQLIVRAEVADSDVRDEFDAWYQNEHLPDAIAAFKALRGWRGWSEIEQNVHYAFYEFENIEQARAISQSSEIRALIAEFDRCWEGRVTRSRDIIELGQELGQTGSADFTIREDI